MTWFNKLPLGLFCLLLLPLAQANLADLEIQKDTYDKLIKQEQSLISEKETLQAEINKLSKKIEDASPSAYGVLNSLRRNNHIKIAQQKKQLLAQVEFKLKKNREQQAALARKMFQAIEAEKSSLVLEMKLQKKKGNLEKDKFVQRMTFLTGLSRFVDSNRPDHFPIEDMEATEQGSMSPEQSKVIEALYKEANSKLQLYQGELTQLKRQARLRQEYQSLLHEEQFYGESQFIHVPTLSESPVENTGASAVLSANQKNENAGNLSPPVEEQPQARPSENSGLENSGAESDGAGVDAAPPVLGVDESIVSPSPEATLGDLNSGEANTAQLEALDNVGPVVRDFSELVLQGERVVDENDLFSNNVEVSQQLDGAQRFQWLQLQVQRLSSYIQQLDALRAQHTK